MNGEHVLGDVVEQVTEKAVGAKDPNLPYVGLEHIDPGASHLRATAPSSISSSTNGVFRPGDILFGKLRPNLRKSVQVNMRGYCSTDLLVLRTRSGFDPRFAGHLLRSEAVFRRAVMTSIGTRMPRTSWSLLRDAPVFGPPLTDQQRIAEALDTADELVDASERVIEKLTAVVDGVLGELLSVSHRWPVRRLADLGGRSRVVVKTGPFGSMLKGDHWVKRGVPVVTIGALGEGEFQDEELLHVSRRTADRLSAYSLQPGDLVFSRVADVGRSVVVPPRSAGWLMSSNLIRVAPDPLQIEPVLLWLLLLKHPHVRSQIRRLVNAGGRDVATGSILQELEVPIPRGEDQGKIVRAYESFFRRVLLERAALHTVRRVREGLRVDLLSGRVRVNGALKSS